MRLCKRVARTLLLASPLVLTSCGGWQSALDVHGESAISLRQLIVLIVAVCSIVWTLVMIALVFALARKRRPRELPLEINPVTDRRMTISVAAAVAVTVVIITAFTVLSFFTTRALSVADSDALTIKVRGLQWWWGVEYFGDAPGERFETANEIHIPVGRKVRLQLEGVDVIHSFWVPSLAGKQDLIPGRPNELTIRAERAGVYRGQCAEFCGLQHAHMAFLVIAEEQGAFDEWVRLQRQGAVAAAGDADALAGQQAFMARQCAACHTVRGTSADGKTGPDLTHIASRMTIAAGLLPTTRGSLAAWIADPQTLKPGNNMPLVPMNPEELRAISAWLASLK
jgi:cytochrome c oxidase subunit 2